MASEKAPATTQAASGTVTRMTAVQRFKEQLKLAATMEDNSDTGAITDAVIERMMTADSLDDAIAAQDASLLSGQSLVDVEQVIYGFDVVKSNKPDAHLGFYFRIHAARLSDGEEFDYACGAPNVMTLLWRAQNDQELPSEWVIKGKETGSGNTLLTLRRIPKRAL